MQNLSSVARLVAAADDEFCVGEFCDGEFCAESVTAETNTAPASNISGVTVRSRIMSAPSHRQTGQTTAQGTPNLYLLTTHFSLQMVPSFARMRSVCIALIALIFASP